MTLRYLYLVLALIGLILPYSQFIPWIVEHHALNMPVLPTIGTLIVSVSLGLPLFLYPRQVALDQTSREA
jgi:hypothetical protein